MSRIASDSPRHQKRAQRTEAAQVLSDSACRAACSRPVAANTLQAPLVDISNFKSTFINRYYGMAHQLH